MPLAGERNARVLERLTAGRNPYVAAGNTCNILPLCISPFTCLCGPHPRSRHTAFQPLPTLAPFAVTLHYPPQLSHSHIPKTRVRLDTGIVHTRGQFNGHWDIQDVSVTMDIGFWERIPGSCGCDQCIFGVMSRLLIRTNKTFGLS